MLEESSGMKLTACKELSMKPMLRDSLERMLVDLDMILMCMFTQVLEHTSVVNKQASSKV